MFKKFVVLLIRDRDCGMSALFGGGLFVVNMIENEFWALEQYFIIRLIIKYSKICQPKSTVCFYPS
jgi:hypothetical protein